MTGSQPWNQEALPKAFSSLFLLSSHFYNEETALTKSFPRSLKQGV